MQSVSPEPPAQWTEVYDESGEDVRAPLQELLHPGLPAPRVSPCPTLPSRGRRAVLG